MVNIKKFLDQRLTKEASLVSPASMTMLTMPGTAQRAEEAYAKAMKQISEGEKSMKTAGFMDQLVSNLSTGALRGAGGMLEHVASPFLRMPGEMALHKMMQPSMQDSFKNEFVKSTGKELGSSAVDALKAMLSGAGGAIGSLGDNSARDTIIAQLKKEDTVIARADDRLLREAFDTMVKFAPTLSKDKNAVRSYLREAVLSGSGPNYATIKMLADAEKSVSGEVRGR